MCKSFMKKIMKLLKVIKELNKKRDILCAIEKVKI